jgi:ferredoxin-fold anticodon binding domain-containing protein
MKGEIILNIIDLANKIINTETHDLCKLCNKKDLCQTYDSNTCLLLEMWKQLCCAESEKEQLNMIRNVRKKLDIKFQE